MSFCDCEFDSQYAYKDGVILDRNLISIIEYLENNIIDKRINKICLFTIIFIKTKVLNSNV